ncbi:esterase/lipase family protein [Colwellia hornerae]|uniref:esterase/lipase family protein n=1 Tax=Colwellia hornerae TaxID=89402 RepID=UPI00294FFE56|nr:alpha/beta fold hydrolase [Colwellia hornerae]
MNEKIAALKSDLALLKAQFTKKITDVEIRLKNMIEQEILENSVKNKKQAASPEHTQTLSNGECVILLHGLARSASSMKVIEKRLSEEGYFVININYPSREYSIEELAEKVISSALLTCEDRPVNFVTHSMGGILVRQYLSVHKIPHLNKVVMLGPPNKGSEVVDKLRNAPGFSFINGDAGMQLGTGELSVPSNLGNANFDLGVIAGNQSINWILSTLIPDKDDGKVSVASTKLDGMNDHIEMETTHPFMMRNDKVIEQVIHYLKSGSFQK